MIVKAILDKRRATKNGTFPVKISFAAFGKTVYESIGLYATPAEFDEVNGLYTLTNKATRIINTTNNALIQTWIARAGNQLTEALRKNKTLTPGELRDSCKSFYKEEQQAPEAESFSDFFLRFLKEKKGKTQITYITTYNKLKSYYGENIQFSDINYSWLMDFDRKMQNAPIVNGKKEEVRKGLEPNSRSIHFRNIRSVFNRAIDEEIIGIELYPFRRFKIPHAKTIKRSIPVSTLRKLLTFSGTPEQNWAVDMASFIFYLIGINVKDLFYLKEYDGEYIYYSRAKTSRPYVIKVEPELKPLFEKYKGKNHLLCFQEQFYLHESLTKKINKYLAQVSSKIGAAKITTYTLRHTWATIAADLDIPKETIAAALGHAQESVTDIYINFNRKKIDEANRKVIDHVFG